MLKEIAPNAFEQFRVDYLAKNYEFWGKKNESGDILWFCERDFRSQLGYYIDYFEKIFGKIPAVGSLKNQKEFVKNIFIKLESKLS